MYGGDIENTFQLRQDRRRVDRNTRTTFDPVALNNRHEEILNLYVLGMKDSEIASMLGISKNMVNYTVTSTLGKERLAMMRGARDAETIDIAKKMQEII